MKERTISIKYMPDKVCYNTVTKKIYESYEITIKYKSNAAYKEPLSIMTQVLYKLSEEQEQWIVKELEKAPLNMSIKKLKEKAAKLITGLKEESI